MPFDRLTRPRNTTDNPQTEPRTLAEGVLAVLAGLPLEQAAAEIRITPVDLSEAIAAYQAAGKAALDTQAADCDWYQVHVQFPDWNSAEHAATTGLAQQMNRLRESGAIVGWWFIRKHPCWRLRLRAAPAIVPAGLRTAVDAVLDDLTAAGTISRWWRTRYEPETAAFGGAIGMGIAHDHFCADSGGVLDFLARAEPLVGRRELSVLLCNAMFRAARLDGFECGDVWHRVAQLRPLPGDVPTDRLKELTDRLRTLLMADVRPTGALFGAIGPLAFAADWASAFERAGHALGQAAGDGRLERGVRAVLTHLVIFHWNRLGLSATTQAILSRAAREVLLPGS
ncbi:thiopeptide-type bacteriocin biosynthesis protein [Sphaerimonospora cavernae]|uniref:Thiopeptide-type bacteriocin biosynthesis protein n=1 Tax=Sphaerimonospora cavernae TaxID=1740611 RepID=A0ABV6TZR4_9ACTN